MAEFVVGRQRGSCDIAVPDDFPAVSRRHIRITELAGGRYRIEDLGSTSGTRVFVADSWQSIRVHEVRGADPIKLANFETTVDTLLGRGPKLTEFIGESQLDLKVPPPRSAPAAAPRPQPAASPGPAAQPAGQRPGAHVYDVFVSYAQVDRDRVQRIVELMERQGLKVFWDRNLRPGQQFVDYIEKALVGSRAAVVVWSAASTKSEWVRAEAMKARELGILVPIQIDDAAIPLPFGMIHTSRLGNLDALQHDAIARQFMETIAAMTSGSAQPGGHYGIYGAGHAAPLPGTRPKLNLYYTLFDLDGRLSRREFWLGTLALVPPSIILGLILAALVEAGSPGMPQAEKAAASGVGGFLIFGYFYLALLGKRIHDFGRSIWWSTPILLILFVATALNAQAHLGPAQANAAGVWSLIACVCYLIIGLHRGDAYANRHGPPRVIR